MSKQGLLFHRCTLCQTVINPWDIYEPPHACPKCSGVRMSPTNLSWWEMFIQICKHPKVWRWNEEHFHG